MQMRFVAIQTLLNFGMMKVNSGHHSGHPNRNIRYYDSEGNDYDKGEGGEPRIRGNVTSSYDGSKISGSQQSFLEKTVICIVER